MNNSFTRTTIFGFSAFDPTPGETRSGKPVCNGGIIYFTRHFYKEDSGEVGQEEVRHFLPFKKFGRGAKRLIECAHKGRTVLLDGVLKQDSNPEGNPTNSYYLDVSDFRFISEDKRNKE